MELKRGAAYWASSMAGLFLLLAFPALFDGIEGLRWPAFFELILKAVFYAVLGALLQMCIRDSCQAEGRRPGHFKRTSGKPPPNRAHPGRGLRFQSTGKAS